jgi:hypothetical protein
MFVANGVLGIRDMGTNIQLADLMEVRKRIAEGLLVGPRIVATGKILDGRPIPISPSHAAIKTPDEGRSAVQSLKADGADFRLTGSPLDMINRSILIGTNELLSPPVDNRATVNGLNNCYGSIRSDKCRYCVATYSLFNCYRATKRRNVHAGVLVDLFTNVNVALSDHRAFVVNAHWYVLYGGSARQDLRISVSFTHPSLWPASPVERSDLCERQKRW